MSKVTISVEKDIAETTLRMLKEGIGNIEVLIEQIKKNDTLSGKEFEAVVMAYRKEQGIIQELVAYYVDFGVDA